LCNSSVSRQLASVDKEYPRQPAFAERFVEDAESEERNEYQ
jgi:hypothetical protein